MQHSGNMRFAGCDRAEVALSLPVRKYSADLLLNEKKESVVSEVLEYKSWVCLICGWIYNEEDGVPEDGIAPGTRFGDIPDTWRCPLCDVGKEDFVAVEF